MSQIESSTAKLASVIKDQAVLRHRSMHRHARTAPDVRESISIVNHSEPLININGVSQNDIGIFLHSNHRDFMAPLGRRLG